MGGIYILSGWASTPLEDVAKATPNLVKWQNIYIFNNRSKKIELIRRAETAGFDGIVVSVDIPVLSKCAFRSSENLEVMVGKAKSMNIRQAFLNQYIPYLLK